MAKQTRKFDGKVYRHSRHSYSHKAEAQLNARRHRKRGFLARIVKRRWGWDLYIRKK